MGLKRTVIISLFTAIMAYYAYNPLPGDIEQPLLVNLHLSLRRVILHISKIMQVFGLQEQHVTDRSLSELINQFLNPTIPNDIKVTDTTFAGVPVRVYENMNKTRALVPGFVYLHGEGFVKISMSTFDLEISEIVRETGVTVVTIEYRLAPEYPSPAALDDCFAASRHFMAHAVEWGVDGSKIGVGGDSAGGNMAAVLSLKFRDLNSKLRFTFQILVYPWVQALDFRLPSYLDNEIYSAPVMRASGMAYFTASYIGLGTEHINNLVNNQHVSQSTRKKYSKIMDVDSLDYYDPADSAPWGEIDEKLAEKIEKAIINPYNFPLMAENLTNLPKALVITVGFDTLCDEGILYSGRLEKAGVPTEHYHDQLCWHGALNYGKGRLESKCGRRILQRIIDYINKAKHGDSTADKE